MNIPLDLIDPGPFDWTLRHVHPQHKVADLARQIEDAGGFTATILVRPHGQRYQLVHGSMRLRAAQLLGYTSIPARVVDVPQQNAIRLAVEDHHNAKNTKLTLLETGWAVLGYQAQPEGEEAPSVRRIAEVFGRAHNTLSPYAGAARWMSREDLEQVVEHCRRKGFVIGLDQVLSVDARTLKAIAPAGSKRKGKALFRRAALALALGRDPATEIERKLAPRTPQPARAGAVAEFFHDARPIYAGNGAWEEIRRPDGRRYIVAKGQEGERTILVGRKHFEPARNVAVNVRPSNTLHGLWARIKARMERLVERFSARHTRG